MTKDELLALIALRKADPKPRPLLLGRPQAPRGVGVSSFTVRRGPRRDNAPYTINRRGAP